jgi:hypothetical protein
MNTTQNNLLKEAAAILGRYTEWHLHDEKMRPKDKETKELIKRITHALIPE